MDVVNYVEVDSETFTCEFGSDGKVKNINKQKSNEIKYTTSDGQIANIQSYVVKDNNGNNLTITSHSNGSIVFSGDVYSFEEIVSTNKITSIILPDCVHSVDFTMALDEITIGEDCTLIQALLGNDGAKTYILKNTNNVTFNYLTVNNVKLCYDEDNNSTITFDGCSIAEPYNGEYCGIYAENKPVDTISFNSCQIQSFISSSNLHMGYCKNMIIDGCQVYYTGYLWFDDIENLIFRSSELHAMKLSWGLIFTNVGKIDFGDTRGDSYASYFSIKGNIYPSKFMFYGEDVMPPFIVTVYIDTSLENSGIKTNTFWKPYIDNGTVDFVRINP